MKKKTLEIIKEKLEKLAHLVTYKGVQPSDIISLCSEEKYREYTLFKEDTSIYLDISYINQEKEPLLGALCKIRYTYNNEMFLQSISEVTDQGFILEWDREDRIKCLKYDLKLLAKSIFNQKKYLELEDLLNSISRCDDEAILKFSQAS